MTDWAVSGAAAGRCTRCGSSNPAGFSFCGSCGAPLLHMACTTCGAAIPPGQRFCGGCGAAVALDTEAPVLPLAAGQSNVAEPMREERKLATVLFADVVGFTTLAEDTDHEAVASAVSEAFTRLAEIVDEHGGTVDKYMGDCLMAVFGVPVAHDDDAERAVVAALAMRDTVGDLRFSIGVNTGEVMATTMPGEGRLTVIGDTVNVAARIEKAAAAGEVLVGPLTAELAADCVLFRERDAMLLRGKREPVIVHEALALRRGDEGRLADSARPPLVGRDDELNFLLSRWRRCVRERRAEAVLLLGEVGSGKSRLLEELAERAAGSRVVAATYPAYGALGGARVVSEVLRQLGTLGDPRDDRLLTSLAGDAHAELDGMDQASLEREQLRVFLRLVENAAEQRPLLITVDEAQRANERTHRFLGELIARADAAVLLVLAGRPEPSDWLVRHPHTTRVRLDPLDPGAAAELAAALVPGGRLSDGAASVLAERGAGNPLHLRELVRLVRDRGGLVDGPAGLDLRGGLTLPPSLHAVLAARLDALGHAEKSALQHTAVLGEDTSAVSLERLGVSGAEDALAHLVNSGLVRQRASGGCEIVDPLLRDVAYESLPRQLRVQLHRRAASLATHDYDRARHLEQALALMPDDAELRGEAASALGAAGNDLAARQRFADAIVTMRHALELGNREVGMLVRLAGLLADQFGGDEVEAVLALVPETDDPEVEAERVHIRANGMARAHTADSIAAYDEARRRWAALGRSDKEAWALCNSAVGLLLLGRTSESAARLEESLAIFEASNDRTGLATAQQTLALIRPDHPRAEEWMNAGLEFALEIGDRGRERFALQNLAFYHFIRAFFGGPADVGTALERAASLAEVGRGMGDLTAEVQAHALAVLLHRTSGDLEAAASEAAALDRLSDEASIGSAGLSAAALAVMALAVDADADVPAPAPPSNDVIAAMGLVCHAEGLLLASRVGEAQDVLGSFGTDSELPAPLLAGFGFASALALLLAGDAESAGGCLVATRCQTEAMNAGPTAAASQALIAEAALRCGSSRDAVRHLLDTVPVPRPGGVAGALLLRPAALLGDAGAVERLVAQAARLRAPGLLKGIPEAAGQGPR
jgi:class 3 adenylate cyclase/tetratricopeptide (TPR) repeat protein